MTSRHADNPQMIDNRTPGSRVTDSFGTAATRAVALNGGLPHMHHA
jgi:hypothetical protein